MNRRDAIARVGLILGGTVVGANAFLTGCKNRPEENLATMDFSPDTISFLNEVGETILPTTAKSPGAKEAKVGEWMKAIVMDCYEEKDQKNFFDGVAKLRKAAKDKYDNDYMDLDEKQRHELLV